MKTEERKTPSRRKMGCFIGFLLFVVVIAVCGIVAIRWHFHYVLRFTVDLIESSETAAEETLSAYLEGKLVRVGDLDPHAIRVELLKWEQRIIKQYLHQLGKYPFKPRGTFEELLDTYASYTQICELCESGNSSPALSNWEIGQLKADFDGHLSKLRIMMGE